MHHFSDVLGIASTHVHWTSSRRLKLMELSKKKILRRSIILPPWEDAVQMAHADYRQDLKVRNRQWLFERGFLRVPRTLWKIQCLSFFLAIYTKNNCNKKPISNTVSLCSRNFQNVKLRLDYVEIWLFYRHSDFTWNQILANLNGPKMSVLKILEVLSFDFSKFEQLSNSKFTKFQSSESLELPKMTYLDRLNSPNFHFS